MPSAALRSLAVRSAVLLAASASVALASGCGSDESSTSSGGSTGSGQTIAATTGKEIFQKAGCVSCHTLAAAGGAGNIGPNLDEEKPPREEIVEKVTNGDGRMPAFKDRLTAQQIDTLADYVVSVEGQ